MSGAIQSTALTIREALQRATAALAQAEAGATPRLDAEVALAHLLGHSREMLYRDAQVQLSPQQQDEFEALIERRLAHEPVAYLTGEREFWSLSFEVTSDVLIPRPETELLVEAILGYAPVLAEQKMPLRLLDVGAGSGIIAVCAARELPAWSVVAMDASTAALDVARRNALRLLPKQGVDGKKVEFVAADLRAMPFQAASSSRLFSQIAANLPYIASDDLADLPRTVREYEPRAALDGGPDGLRFIRALLAQAPALLVLGGLIHLEAGIGQVAALRGMMPSMPYLRVEAVLRDLAGVERAIVLRRVHAKTR